MGSRFKALCMGVLRAVSDLGCIFFVSYPLDLNNVPRVRSVSKASLHVKWLFTFHVLVCARDVCLHMHQIEIETETAALVIIYFPFSIRWL